MTLGTTEIPADVPVLAALGAANRDPEHFPTPNRLDLAATSHLAFGHGTHRCVSTPLAKPEADIALRAILTRFPRLRLAELADELSWRKTRPVRGLVMLPVQTEPLDGR